MFMLEPDWEEVMSDQFKICGPELRTELTELMIDSDFTLASRV